MPIRYYRIGAAFLQTEIIGQSGGTGRPGTNGETIQQVKNIFGIVLLSLLGPAADFSSSTDRILHFVQMSLSESLEAFKSSSIE